MSSFAVQALLLPQMVLGHGAMTFPPPREGVDGGSFVLATVPPANIGSHSASSDSA